MDEVIPGLWIGDLESTQNVSNLREHGVFSILSAMRGRISIHETFIRHQIKLDDSEDADVLTHLLPSIHFISTELGKGRGVLVHCHAGVSRSSTVVAAYLMQSRQISPQAALELIKRVRPFVAPNQGFLNQLELFYSARYQISRKEKAIRMYYMGKAVEEVMNGDGSAPETEMFAKCPTPSNPSNPGHSRRRIRCKMCRQELATREHMLDHGQLGPPTPEPGTPSVLQRPSNPVPSQGLSSHFPSHSGLGEFPTRASTQEIHPLASLRSLPQSMVDQSFIAQSTPVLEINEEKENGQEDLSIRASQMLGRRISDAVIGTLNDSNKLEPENRKVAELSDTNIGHPTTHLISPSDLTAQLFSNPQIAALRSPQPGTSSKPAAATSAPILANPKCSGYFVEPMQWMEHFLSSGQLAGKITCPNKKCGAKLGNYDWAGLRCGCNEWVTPGFCISRSKVDEVL